MKPYEQIYNNSRNFRLKWDEDISLLCVDGDFLLIIRNTQPELIEYLKQCQIDFQLSIDIIYIYFGNIGELDTVLKYLDLEMR